VQIDWNTQVPMRDGTRLSADIHRVGDDASRTTLAARTPYNKNTAAQQDRAQAYARNGYNFAWMDVRGPGDSEGQFVPWRNERLCDGMIRARFRNGYSQQAEPLVPGEIVQYEIDLWSTSHVFLAGHRIRLEVSSSAFPKYDRNLNTGGPLATGTEMATAANSVWHTAGHPSHLILPEIPARASG
jgi:predicted acyl esterase